MLRHDPGQHGVGAGPTRRTQGGFDANFDADSILNPLICEINIDFDIEFYLNLTLTLK